MLARVLYATAGTLGLVGVALQLAPAQRPGTEGGAAELVPPNATPPTRVAAATAAPTAYAAIVTANVFSAERIPPRVRFTPAGLASRDAPLPRGGRAAPAVLLYGITVGEQGATALIDADPQIPGAEIYRVGDLVAGAPILEITDSTVVLAQPSGVRVLRLQRSGRKRP